MISQLFGRGRLGSDLLTTLVGGVVVAISVLVLYGLIARAMGTEALGDFLLVRRTAFALMGVLLVGMNIGLPFYVAGGNGQAYSSTALAIWLLLTVPLIGLVSWVLSTGWIFGFPTYLILPFFAFTCAYALQFLAYGLLRGRLNMRGAALLSFVGTGLIPIGVFLILKERSVPRLLLFTGLAALVSSGLVYLRQVLSVGGRLPQLEKTRQLLSYGGQRIAGFAAEFVVLAAVPLLILSSSSRTDVAYVNSGISLVRLFITAIAPLGIVLLPRIARARAQGNSARIDFGLDILTKATLLVGAPLALLLGMNSAAILRVWLGAGNEPGAWVLQTILVAFPFYLLVVLLRSPIDAASTRGYNTLVYGLAALALLITFYSLELVGMTSVQRGVISFVTAQVTGAVASLYLGYRFYRINIINPRYLASVLVMLSIATVLLRAIQSVLVGPAALLVGGAALAVMLGLYFVTSKSDWVVGFRSLAAVMFKP